VMWAAARKEHVMESREYTAADFAFNLNRLLVSPSGTGLRTADFIESVTATDKYTVVVETKKFYPEWWWSIGGEFGQHIPPEVVEAGAGDYDNLIGTGPFILTERVPGSHMLYTANPDYWDTTTINGVEYQIPFVDEIIMPLIGEGATAIAALRTATVDIHMRVFPPDFEHLAQSSPELLTARGQGGFGNAISLGVDQPPLNDKEVRRALMIGTNIDAIFKANLLMGETYAFPIAPGVPGHVPLEELPAETRLLFDYNPVLARQMLADAGYPDGFTLEMHSSVRPDWLGIAEMVAGMWKEDLNIDVEIKTYEKVAFRALMTAKELLPSASVPAYPGLAFTSLGQAYYPGGWQN
ncbi:hypothetical protein LCGC14_3064020, partial [marine sediment metagenome]